MATLDKRIDRYIAQSRDFAQPVLTHLRKLVHKACPAVEETIKWGFPHFDYAEGILCSMASFKQHCAFGFWKASLMSDPRKILSTVGRTSMGHLGKLTSVSDLPADKILLSYIREAARLNKDDVRRGRERPKVKKPLRVPDYFNRALKKNTSALTTFEAFSPSHKREYVEWITEAKSNETRERRIETAIQWMAEGKARNWKYMKK